MPARLEPYQDSPAARAELAGFLARQFPVSGTCTEPEWQRRFAHWWDENPFAHAHPGRGWVLHQGREWVGYLGVIPALYDGPTGLPVPALMATSWVVAEGHRHAALPMGLALQRQGKDTLLVDTTPSLEVQRLLDRWGWLPTKQVRRSFIVRVARLHSAADRLGAGLHITGDLSRVESVNPARPRSCLQKHITPDYLRWYAAAPARRHSFLGIVDREGVLSSCLMITPGTVKRLPAWQVVDWFTCRENSHELQALVRWLMRHSPCAHGGWRPLISLAAFPPFDTWQGLPLLHQRAERINHYHFLPPGLRGVEMRHVLAEGDWGL